MITNSSSKGKAGMAKLLEVKIEITVISLPGFNV